MDNEQHKINRFSRRQFLALTTTAVAGALATTGGYLYLNNEANEPVVEYIQLPIKDLAPGLAGFTIAVLADFHLYPLTQIELINKAVTMANALQPDLTVLLGDYVWRDVEAIFELAPVLAKLNAKYGLYSILGNHDLWTDAAVITHGLSEARIPLLRNEGVPITVGKDTLFLAGLDDGWSGKPDLQAALAQRPLPATTVLLMHEPDLADEYALDKSIALQLSGHSHGGQVRFRGIGAVILPYLAWKYDMGLYQIGDMWLYTNRGLGVTNEPVRYNCPPEITLITLV